MRSDANTHLVANPLDIINSKIADTANLITPPVNISSLPVGTTIETVAAGNHTHPGGSEAFPIGSVYISVVPTNPSILLGYGSWSAFAAGRVLVGIDSGQTEFDTVEETGGSKTHTLTESEIPAHTHTLQRFPNATGSSVGFTVDTSMSGQQSTTALNTTSTGGDGAHNNLQPYVVVYMWKRVL